MTDFIPLGYMTMEQALDEVGRHLMPDEWRGTEIALLKSDSALLEEISTSEEAPTADILSRRLNRALRFLIRALFVGDVNAVIVREHGEVRPFPSSLWQSPSARTIFRAGELPVQLHVALEGHKADAGKRWVLIPRPALHRMLSETGPGAELPDIESELRAWLTKKIEECAARGRPSKKQLWTEAQAFFGPPLGYRFFSRIWSAIAPKSGSRRSRPLRTGESEE